MTIFEEEIRSQGVSLRARSEAGASPALRAALRTMSRSTSSNSPVKGSDFSLPTRRPHLYEGERQVQLGHVGVIAISRPGRSPGIVKVLDQARTQSCPTATLTSYVTSPWALASDTALEFPRGPERATSSTATFSTRWHALAHLMQALCRPPLEGMAQLPDVILVSGPVAGAEPDVATVADVREAVDPSVPVLLNTGAKSAANAQYLKFAAGSVVGSDLTRDGYTWNEVDRERVKRFVDVGRNA